MTRPLATCPGSTVIGSLRVAGNRVAWAPTWWEPAETPWSSNTPSPSVRVQGSSGDQFAPSAPPLVGQGDGRPRDGGSVLVDDASPDGATDLELDPGGISRRVDLDLAGGVLRVRRDDPVRAQRLQPESPLGIAGRCLAAAPRGLHRGPLDGLAVGRADEALERTLAGDRDLDLLLVPGPDRDRVLVLVLPALDGGRDPEDTGRNRIDHEGAVVVGPAFPDGAPVGLGELDVGSADALGVPGDHAAPERPSGDDPQDEVVASLSSLELQVADHLAGEHSSRDQLDRDLGPGHTSLAVPDAYPGAVA